MAYIYIVISETSTKIGKFIRYMTGEKYNHVSIALHPSLQPLYAFSRYYKKKPFYGGFTEESWLRYQQHNPQLNIAVYKIPVSARQKAELAQYIDHLNKHRKEYRYSLLDAANCYFPKMNYQPIDKYTCLGFAVKLLHDLNYLPSNEKIYSIAALQHKLNRFPHYYQQLQFTKMPQLSWGEDDYLTHKTLLAKFLCYLHMKFSTQQKVD